MSHPYANSGRLHWKCRRGMLELDIFLTRFLKHGYAQLDEDERTLFEELLEESDPVLYSWLLEHTVPDDKDVASLIDKICQCSHKP